MLGTERTASTCERLWVARFRASVALPSGAATVRAIEIAGNSPRVLITNDAGEFAFLNVDDARLLDRNQIAGDHPRYGDLFARGFVRGADDDGMQRLEAAVARTRKSFLLDGPALHIFVLTLRCDHSCQYCQVSRAALNASGKDMSRETAHAAVERVFQSPSQHLTIEFQGGEPALRFDLVRYVVQRALQRNEQEGRLLRFTMATTLHLLGSEELEFCREHRIHLSTSIDGPAALHTRQRPNATRDSGARTLEALARAREVLGDDGVAALPTLTRQALADPAALIDSYRDLGFRSIFLRPLSPYGFALKTRRSLGYAMTEFLDFYERALEYVLELNREGEDFEETTAAILLRHILTPFHSGYVDLRSPSGAGIGVLVYNYDGRVHPTDEARMAAETGDSRFVLGSVQDPLDHLLSSPAMRWLATGAVAEKLPGCATCAFVPYCGSDPVHHATTQGDPAADRAGSEFCDKHMGIFRLLFRHLADGDPETLRTFNAWALRRSRRELGPSLESVA